MINLGDKVVDTITGFKGTAISKHVYLAGCTRFSVQPKVNKEGALPKIETFNEPQLEIVEKEQIAQMNTEVGGPEKYMPED